MWPIRCDRLSDVLSADDIRGLLALGLDTGSVLGYAELADDETVTRIESERTLEELRPNAFCTFFRHATLANGVRAFRGADEACADCETRLARAALRPAADGATPGGVTHRRCHMGLTDFVVPVEMNHARVGVIVGGRVVRSDDDRERIRKITNRLGTVTRAEAASGANPIEPANDKVRKQLLHEIAEIPLAPEDMRQKIAAHAGRLGEVASRQFESRRLEIENGVLLETESWSDAPASRGEVHRETSLGLDRLRKTLGFESIVLFARAPKDLDGEIAVLSITGEAGLGVGTKNRVVDLDWRRLIEGRGELDDSMQAERGVDSISPAINALHPVTDAGTKLKDCLAKSLFLACFDDPTGREAAVVFGPHASDVPPDTADFRFLVRLARSIARRYYTLAAECERRRLAERLEKRDERIKSLEGRLKEITEAERLARYTKGFTDFDAAKLVRSRVDEIGERAREVGVEIDTRTLPEKLPMRAHRALLGDAITQLIELGFVRTKDAENGKKPPIRLFIRRNRSRIQLGVEAIGDPLTQADRQKLLRSRDDDAGNGANGEKNSAGPKLGVIFKAARRHKGRVRLESERLRRVEGDPRAWVGQVTMLLELPGTLERVKPDARDEPASELRG